MSKNRNKKLIRKKWIIIVSMIILVISTVLYMLAYRYLIERAEAPATDNISSTNSISQKFNIKYDDWNYESDNMQISIEEVTKEDGKDKITYFVADVKLKDSSYLHSAFAKNTFGRNITETTSEIAENNEAIFAINGDYYGFRSDGVLIRNGKVYRDTPARTSAAFYDDGTMKVFDETKISSDELLKNGVINTFSFGPILVDDGKIVDDFEHVVVDTNFGNRSIQRSNPRTGVGMIEQNHFVFVVVDGRSENYSKGMTLSEFAEVFKELGCTEAYNLDGGGSSTMYFMGRVVNNPLGEGKERKISDIIYLKE